MKRRSLLAAPALLPALAHAQPSVPLVGVVRTGRRDDDLFMPVFRRDMARLGWEEGRNCRLEFAFADSNVDRLSGLATGLVQAGAQVLVVFSVLGVAAAQAATKTLPIVAMADDLELVMSGQVASVARPGGNTTGVSILGRLLDIKRLEVLHELVPGARRIGIITDGTPSAVAELGKVEEGARKLGLATTVAHVRSEGQIAGALAGLEAARVEAVQFFASTFLQAERFRFMDAMTRMKMPAIYEWPETVEEGGLSSYGPRLSLCYRHVAVLTSRVLRGARPADLPIEQPSVFTLGINTGAARKIGIVLPETMLLRADLLVD
jgi:putative ABC transport system substrate-binding protein